MKYKITIIFLFILFFLRQSLCVYADNPILYKSANTVWAIQNDSKSVRKKELHDILINRSLNKRGNAKTRHNLKSLKRQKANSNLLRGSGKYVFEGSLSLFGQELFGQIYNRYSCGELFLSNMNYSYLGETAVLGGAAGLTQKVSENILNQLFKGNKYYRIMVKANKFFPHLWGNVFETFFMAYGYFIFGRSDFETAKRDFIAGMGNSFFEAAFTAIVIAVIGLPTGFSGKIALWLAGVGTGFSVEQIIKLCFKNLDKEKYHQKKQERIERMLSNCSDFIKRKN